MKTPDAAYEQRKKRSAADQREQSSAGREIGPLPAVADPDRKAACRSSLRAFCETYLAAEFALRWSDDHLKVIAKIEAAALVGGLFAVAMPRGSGKTTLAEAAALWAIVYGHRRFVVLIGATGGAACDMLDSIKVTVEANDLLADDFPEVCHPIRALEGVNNRAPGQTLGGGRTRISWTNDEAVFPTVPGSAASGARIRVAGIDGRIRGMKVKTAEGKTIRPDFAIPDDPQTDSSAVSLIEINKRERRLLGAVKGLAGPGKTIAMVVPCTVIAPRDLSDRILDRDRNPQFQGERLRMVDAWPTSRELWDEYAELRRQSLKNDGKGEEATEFYAANRAAMDAGAAVAWAERFDPARELSALQAAMNLWIDNPKEFAAEYQNDPAEDEKAAGAKELDPQRVAARVAGTDRLTVPRECSRLTAFVDVGGQLHWYAVVAWDDTFGGAVVDYGTWPRQTRAVFAADDPRPGLSDAYPGLDESARVYAGLRDLTADVLGRTYVRDGSTSGDLRIERCLIDCGWSADAVHRFCRASPHAGVIYPSKGIGRTISARGVSEWTTKKPGERFGYHWLLGTSETGKGRMVKFDPDAWKTFLYERLTTPEGSRGSLGFWGRDAARHEQIGQHCAAEAAEPVTIRGATFDKWQQKPHRPDNHLWDCLIGCAVAASVAGLTWSPGAAAGVPDAPKVKREKRDALAEWKKARGIT